VSDSTETTNEAVIVNWSDGLTEPAEAARVKHAEKAAAEILRHLRNGDREAQAVCTWAEKVHRLYLKGDKARLTLFFAPGGPLGARGVAWQTAYRWIQAGRALRTFSDALKPHQADDPIGVNALALYDRYVATPELQAIGRERIAAEAVAAATEGRQPFSAAGVQSTITPPAVQVTDEGETVKASAEKEKQDRDDRRIGKIAVKHDAAVRTGYPVFLKAITKGLPPAVAKVVLSQGHLFEAYMDTLKAGSAMGAASGGSIGLGLDKIMSQWKAEKVLAEKERAEAERTLALATAESSILLPDEAAADKAATEATAAEKRAERAEKKKQREAAAAAA
jgi:hypothetical protein